MKALEAPGGCAQLLRCVTVVPPWAGASAGQAVLRSSGGPRLARTWDGPASANGTLTGGPLMTPGERLSGSQFSNSPVSSLSLLIRCNFMNLKSR